MKNKRWAFLRAVLFICITALGLPPVASASDDATDSGTMPAVLTSITVSPVNPSVVSGQTEQFTAQGLDQDGNVMTGVAFIWGIASSQSDAGTIDSSTGVFTAGTTSGTYTDAIEAKSDDITGTVSVTVPPAALGITTVSLVDGQEAVDYSQTLVATGGTSPYTWSITTGSLPDGLSLNGDTISGTPTITGTYNFTADVTDSTSPTPNTVTMDLSITISPADPTTSDNITEITSDNTTEITSDNITEITPDNITEITPDNTTEITSDDTTEITSDDTTEITSDDTTEITSDNITEITPFIVRLVAGLSEAAQQQVIARNGGIETSSVLVLNTHFIKVPNASVDEVVQRYKSDPDVRSIEYDTVRKVGEASSDPSYPDQWALPKISWDFVFGSVIPTGSSVIAILDTGIDASHPDLSGLVLSGYSAFEGSDAQTDPNGHGTKMAGIAAALTNNGIGVAGVAYAGVSLLPIQVLGADGTGQDSDIINGIVWAVGYGANVILMAFSNPDYSAALQEAIDYAWDHGIILVAAAGNDGLNTLTYPAGDRGVIGVSATDPDDALVPSSNYGQLVFLAAPGVNLLTTGSNGDYTAISGTSAAAAVVAGAAAFMHAVDPSLSNGAIVGRLARAADPVGSQEQVGNGRLNMARALNDTGTDPVQPAGASPLGDGGPYVGPYTAAAIRTSTATGGAWTTGGTWVGGIAPLATDSVIIATTGANTVTTAGSRTCAGITINSGSILSMANSNVLTVNGGVSGAGQFTLGGTSCALTLTGDFSFTGTYSSASRLTVTFSGPADQTIASTAVATWRGITVNKSGGTLFMSMTPTISSTTTLTAGDISYNRAGAQTVLSDDYPANLTLSGSGAKTLQTGTTTVTGDLILSGTATTTTVVGLTISGDLIIGNGTTFTAAGYNLTVTGATTIGDGATGNLVISSTSGTKIFTGLVTVNAGGIWNNSASEAITFRGGISNSGTFTAGTGIQTFSTNAQALTGTFSIPSVTVTGVTLTNVGTLTVTTALAGTGGLTNSATGTLNINFTGSAGISTLTATAIGNTVNYGFAGTQTVLAVSYYNLTLSNSGAKTLQTGTTTVSGDLTLSGMATTTTVVGLTISGDLIIGNGTTFTAAGFNLTVTGTTTVGEGTSGNLVISSTSGTKIFTGLVTINANGIWNNSASEAITFRGGISNSGTFTAGTGIQTFNTNAQALSGTLSIPRVTVTGVTLTNDGTLTVTTALAGTGGLTNSATGTLNINFTGSIGINTLTATAIGNTVNYGFAGAQTVEAVDYYHLTLSNSGAKTMAGVITIGGDLTISGTATMTGNDSFTVTGALNYGSSGTTTLTASTPISIGTFSQTAGTLVDNGNTITVTGAGANTWTKSGGTFTATGTVTFTGAAPQIGASNFRNLTINVGSSNTATITGVITVSGTLTINSGTTLADGGFVVTANGNVANSGTHSGAGKISLAGGAASHSLSGSGTYDNLELNDSNGASLTVSPTINGALTLTSGSFSIGANTLTLNGAVSTTSGSLTGGASSNIIFGGSGASTTLPVVTLNDLTINRANGISLGGAVTVGGTLTLTSGTFTVGANTLTLNGPAIAGTPSNLATTSSSSLSFGGSSAGVNIPSSVTALNNLTINNSNGITLNSNPTISGTLTFTSGNLLAGSNTVIIPAGGTVSRTSGHVIGNLQKNVALGATSRTFEVGTASAYNPATIVFGNVTTAGNLIVKATSGQHPNIGTSTISSSKNVNEYWSLTNSGVVFNSYSATFTFVAGDILGGANPSNFIVGDYNGGWTYPTVGTKTATTTQATGITSFGDFCLGELKIPPAVNSVILVNASMTPQTEQTVTINVSNIDGKAALNTLVLKLWYDSSGSDYSESTFDSRTADTQNCAIITWTQSTDSFVIQPSSSTTWALGVCLSPGSLPGDFTFHFTVGKVATATSGSARWQVAAKVSNDAGQTGFNYDSTPPTMDWYGEISINTVNITWGGTVALGSGFTDDATNRITNISLTFICNGNYNMQVKASSSWSGSGESVVLATTDTPGNGEFALKADDDATLSGAILVLSTGYATFGIGTQTSESGNAVTNNSLWLKLGASGIPDVQYSGTIYFMITP